MRNNGMTPTDDLDDGMRERKDLLETPDHLLTTGQKEKKERIKSYGPTFEDIKRIMKPL